MEYRILGPLEVLEDGQPVPLGGSKQRALLVILLLHANEVVSRDRLIDELWGGSPPDTAQTALHVHVSQLRKILGSETIVTLATRLLDPGCRGRVRPRPVRAARRRGAPSGGR